MFWLKAACLGLCSRLVQQEHWLSRAAFQALVSGSIEVGFAIFEQQWELRAVHSLSLLFGRNATAVFTAVSIVWSVSVV